MKGVSFIKRIKWLVIALIVIFPLLFLGGVHVGFVSIRMIVAYGLFAYALIFCGKGERPGRDVRMYYIYVAVYIFINLISFSAFSDKFIKELIAVHFVSLIAIFAFPRVFKTEVAVRSAFLVLVLGFLLDAIVTILQYQDSPWGWTIGLAINPIQAEELDEMQALLGEANEFEASFIPGIMGTAPLNGYFVAIMLPVVTYMIWDKFKLKTLWALGMFVLAAVGVYYIQQRMAMVVLLVYLLAILFLKKRSAINVLFTGAVVVLIVAYFKDAIFGYDYSQIGRLSSTEDEYRFLTLPYLNDFINDPRRLLLGYNQNSTIEDHTVFLVLGHNTFIDALRRGGIFLFIVNVVLFYYICKSLVKIFSFSRRIKDYRTMGMAMSCLCFLLYSQTHSIGVQSGSILFWALYMLTLQSHRVKLSYINSRNKWVEATTQVNNVPVVATTEISGEDNSSTIQRAFEIQNSNSSVGWSITPVPFRSEDANKVREEIPDLNVLKMNIAIIAYDYSDERRTVFPFVTQLVEQWAKMGHDCWVIAPYSVVANRRTHIRKEVIKQEGQGTITVLRPNYLTIPKLENGGRRALWMPHYRAVQRALRWLPCQPDVIYGHFWEQAHEGFRFAQKYDIPLFVAAGESDIASRISKWSDKAEFCDYVRGVVCVSDKSKKECVELGLAAEENCEVIPNAVNSALFCKLDKRACRRGLGIDEDAFVVVYVGWFNERKGARRVAQAIKACDDSGIMSMFIGVGPDEPVCPNIIVKGRRPHREIPRYLNAADVFVLPTLNEGCSNAIVEALACGLPVISSDRDFNRGILDENNSIMVEPTDIDAISNAILSLKNNPALCQKMSKASLESAKSFRIENRAARIIELFEQQLHSGFGSHHSHRDKGPGDLLAVKREPRQEDKSVDKVRAELKQVASIIAEGKRRLHKEKKIHHSRREDGPGNLLTVKSEYRQEKQKEKKPWRIPHLNWIIIIVSVIVALVAIFVVYSIFKPHQEEVQEVTVEEKDTVVVEEPVVEDGPEWEIYDKMDSRLHDGDYYIIALDRTITAREGDNAIKIARRVYGSEQKSCYIEVYNGISDTTELQTGEEVRIPKLVRKQFVKKNKRQKRY